MVDLACLVQRMTFRASFYIALVLVLLLIIYSLKSPYLFTREESFDYLITIYMKFKFNFLFCLEY